MSCEHACCGGQATRGCVTKGVCSVIAAGTRRKKYLSSCQLGVPMASQWRANGQWLTSKG
eukprot:2716746-Prymnesium_polylepis.1